MTIEQRFRQAELARQLWASLMDVEPPQPAQFLRWLAAFGDEVLCDSISRTARKLARTPAMTALDAWKYTTATAGHLKREQQGTAAHTLRTLSPASH